MAVIIINPKTKIPMRKKWHYLLLLVTLACSTPQDGEVSPITESQSPSLVDGRLKFKTAEGIADFIKSYTNKYDAETSLDKISEFNATLSFRSVFDKRHKINPAKEGRTDDSDEVIDDINVSIDPISDSIRLSDLIDPRLASVVDEKKELEINDETIVRFQNDYTFLYKKGNQSVLREYYLALKDKQISPPVGKTGIDFKGVKVYKTEVTINGLGTMAREKKLISGKTKEIEYTCDVRSGDDWWRVYGRAYTHYSFVYTSAGLEAHSQSKRRKCKTFSGCWYTWDVGINVPYFQLKYDIWVATYAPIARYTEQRSGNNNNVISHFFGEISGFDVPGMTLSGWYCTSANNPSYGYLNCSNVFNIIPNLAYTPTTCP